MTYSSMDKLCQNVCAAPDLGVYYVLCELNLESERSISGFESANGLKAFYFLLAGSFLSSLQCSISLPLYAMALAEC